MTTAARTPSTRTFFYQPADRLPPEIQTTTKLRVRASKSEAEQLQLLRQGREMLLTPAEVKLIAQERKQHGKHFYHIEPLPPLEPPANRVDQEAEAPSQPIPQKAHQPKWWHKLIRKQRRQPIGVKGTKLVKIVEAEGETPKYTQTDSEEQQRSLSSTQHSTPSWIPAKVEADQQLRPAAPSAEQPAKVISEAEVQSDELQPEVSSETRSQMLAATELELDDEEQRQTWRITRQTQPALSLSSESVEQVIIVKRPRESCSKSQPRIDRRVQRRRVELTRKRGALQRIYAAAPQQQPCSTGRVLWVLREAESLDDTLPGWQALAFKGTDCRVYSIRDCNQPQRLAQRPGGPVQYVHDPPITELGMAMARLVGRGLAMNGVQPAAVFASPALRCVQTAHYMLAQMAALGEEVQIRVEPALFDRTSHYRQMPLLLSPEEMREIGLKVDSAYKPSRRMESIGEETMEEANRRQQVFIEKALQESDIRSQLVIVGHCITVDAAGRLLLGKGNKVPDAYSDEAKELKQLPFCAMLTLKENSDENKWEAKNYNF